MVPARIDCAFRGGSFRSQVCQPSVRVQDAAILRAATVNTAALSRGATSARALAIDFEARLHGVARQRPQTPSNASDLGARDSSYTLRSNPGKKRATADPQQRSPDLPGSSNEALLSAAPAQRVRKAAISSSRSESRPPTNRDDRNGAPYVCTFEQRTVQNTTEHSTDVVEKHAAASAPTSDVERRRREAAARWDRPEMLAYCKDLNERIMKGDNVQAVLTLARDNFQALNYVNVATVFFRLAKLVPRSAAAATMLDLQNDSTLIRMRAAVRDALPVFDTYAVSNMAWAHNELPLGPQDLPDLFLKSLESQLREDPQAMVPRVAVAILRLYSQQKGRAPEARERLASVVRDVHHRGLHDWNVWSLATLARICWKDRLMDRSLSKAIADAARPGVAAASVHSISMLLWSFSKAGRTRGESETQLFADCADVVLERARSQGLHDWRPWESTQLMWAFATAAKAAVGGELKRLHRKHRTAEVRDKWPQVPVAEVMEELMHVVTPQLHAADGITLSAAVWAAGALVLYDERFMSAAVARACALGDQLSFQAAATLFWGMGRLGYRDEGAEQLLAQNVCRAFEAEVAKVHTGCQAASGLSTAPTALDSVNIDGTLRRQIESVGQLGSMSLHACAALGCDGEAVQRLARGVGAFVGRAGALTAPQTLTVTCWSLVVLDEHHDQRIMAPLLRAALSFGDKVNTVELAQLAQVDLAMQLEVPWYAGGGWIDSGDHSAYLRDLYLLGANRKTVEHSWLWHMSGTSKVTQLHNSVSDALTRLGVPSTPEWPVQGMSVDIGLPQASVGIEVDGPHHFAANKRLQLGATAFKHRLLVKIGFRTVHVRYFEWPSDPEEQEAHVLAALGTLGLDLESVTARPSGGDNVEQASALDSEPAKGSSSRAVLDLAAEASSMKIERVESAAAAGGEVSEQMNERAQRADLVRFRQGRLNKGAFLKKVALRRSATHDPSSTNKEDT